MGKSQEYSLGNALARGVAASRSKVSKAAVGLRKAGLLPTGSRASYARGSDKSGTYTGLAKSSKKPGRPGPVTKGQTGQKSPRRTSGTGARPSRVPKGRK